MSIQQSFLVQRRPQGLGKTLQYSHSSDTPSPVHPPSEVYRLGFSDELRVGFDLRALHLPSLWSGRLLGLYPIFVVEAWGLIFAGSWHVVLFY